MKVQLPIYLDHHATTPVDPRVVEAMRPYWSDDFGNASSAGHRFGWAHDKAKHGIGTLKRPWLGCSRSDEEIALMQGIKSVFDPAGILNPGKLLPSPASFAEFQTTGTTL